MPPIAPVPPTAPASPSAQAPIPMTYAGFWLRVVAALIDGIVVLLVTGVIASIVGTVTGGPAAQFTVQVVAVIATLLYFALFESSPKQATPGKMLVGIRVTALDATSKVSFLRALGRTLAKYLSTLIILIGYLMAAFTSRKQALHDMLAGTLVVRDARTHPGRGILVLVVLLIVVPIIVAVFGASVLFSYYAVYPDHASGSAAASSSPSDASPAAASPTVPVSSASVYDAALAEPVPDVASIYDGAHVYSGPLFVAWDGIFLRIALPDVPNLGADKAVLVDVAHAYDASGKDVNDTTSDFNTDPFFQAVNMSRRDDPAQHYSGTRSVYLVQDLPSTAAVRLSGTVTIHLPLSDGSIYTKTYPFDVSRSVADSI